MGQPVSTADAAPFRREEFHPTEAAFVRTLSIRALMSLYDVARASQEALFGTYPTNEDSQAIAGWVEDETDRLGDLCSFVIEEMKRRPMSGRRAEDQRRASYVLEWSFHQCAGSGEEALATLAALLESGRLAQERLLVEERLS